MPGLHNTEVVYVKRLQIRNYNHMYLPYLDYVGVVLSTSIAIVSILCAVGAIDINNFIYALSTGVLILFFVIIVHAGAAFYYWLQRSENDLTHDHMFKTTVQLLFGVPLFIFSYLALGLWLTDFTDGTDFSDTQPDETDPPNYIRYVFANGTLATSALFIIYLYAISIRAHRHPEVEDRFHNQFIHVSEVPENVLRMVQENRGRYAKNNPSDMPLERDEVY